MATTNPLSNPSTLSTIDTGTAIGMPRTVGLPTGILQSGLLSSTSNAGDCFVNQQFSAKLQAYLIGYVSSAYSYYSIYE